MDKNINYSFNRLDASKLRLFTIFLDNLQKDASNMFNPHKFDIETINQIIEFSLNGPDEYWVLGNENEIVAYGLLRGWSEGFTIPSIGVAVSKSHRYLGLGKKMILFLHSRAKDRGATKARLTVYKENISAINLYTKIGYNLEPYTDKSLVGFITL